MTEKAVEVQRTFSRSLKASEKVGKLQSKLVAGKAVYKDAEKYAELVGRAYAEAYKDVIGTAAVIGGEQYFEIAKEVFPQGLHSIFSDTAAYVEQVQRLQNESAGIGLKPLIPNYGDVQSKYLEKLAEAATDEGMDAVIPAESELFAQRVVDKTLQINAEAHNRAGLKVLVTRIYDDVGVHNRKDDCEWCLSRCGENMTLEEAYAKEAFNRHPGCGCEIIYTSSKGETTVNRGGGWEKIRGR